MNRSAYLDAVSAELRGLTDHEKAAVRRELEGHIEDHTEALRAHGYSEDEAEERATAQMGDPTETGRGIAALYRPFWLWVERVAGVLIAVMILHLLLGTSALYWTWSSLYARVCTPDDAVIHLDERMAVGDDVVRLYGISGYRPGEACEVLLNLCAYDRSPFGIVHQNIWSWLQFRTGESADERPYAAGGGGWSNMGVSYHHVRMALGPEDTCITLRYARFGQVYECVIDLTEVSG